MKSAAALIAATLVAAPVLAQAPQKKKEEAPIPPGSTFRCVAKDGKKYYGSAIPPQCVGQILEVISPNGVLIRHIDPADAERERQAKAAAENASQAEQAAVKQRDLANKDIERRYRALLATYMNEREVEDARQRALAENRKSAAQFEAKIAELRQKRARYEKELALYKDKKDEKSTTSSKVVEENMNVTDLDLQSQEQLLKEKLSEVPGINARFDDEMRRFKEAVQYNASKPIR
jgi:hypothetical protein